MAQLLTTGELAERLHVQPSTVKLWVRKGKIPVLRISHRVVRFDLNEVITALCEEAKQKRKANRGEK